MSLRAVLSLWRALTDPGPRLGRSSVALFEEYERLAAELAATQDLGERMALLARVAVDPGSGPVARDTRFALRRRRSW